MTTQEVCKLLEHTTYFVNVYLKKEKGAPELISGGSAVAINSTGDLLTAAHVVTTRLPIREKDVRDPNLSIQAGSKRSGLIIYKPKLCGLTIKLEKYLTKPLTIDLAVLRPIEPQKSVPFLPLSLEPPGLGAEVLMAGYPDDIELPFSFDKKLKPSNPQVPAQSLNLDIARRLLMIRSGMVGYLSEVEIVGFSSGHMFYVDNVLHAGASGGPVVNYNGDVVGIVTERAITDVPFEATPELRVPSGAALALTPRFIFQQLRDVDIIFSTT